MRIRGENIRAEIERAQNAIESADLLFMNGYQGFIIQ